MFACCDQVRSRKLHARQPSRKKHFFRNMQHVEVIVISLFDAHPRLPFFLPNWLRQQTAADGLFELSLSLFASRQRDVFRGVIIDMKNDVLAFVAGGRVSEEVSSEGAHCVCGGCEMVAP